MFILNVYVKHKSYSVAYMYIQVYLNAALHFKFLVIIVYKNY